ncbi:hypothetical protein EGJ51_18000 [Pseudomonas fulva]|uniref:hypothetical protein n=1 Tax=Pseudomonas fulva TaxID=47880 RepID=UPI000F777E01|nr:hypothetical protein [Pseudomonas fulva]MBA1218170.1 hypothetical protein [Pseudomonas fulva]RRW59530.1 hypothetical protein EGJ51_18000 [Pseudomonas fulva]
MIHYHGTPIGGTRVDAARFLAGRHALVPFPRQDDMGIVAEVCQSFVFDNGAFSVWKRGAQLDTEGYYRWVEDWYRHPGFDWALIPDVIDGDEESNDLLIGEWPSSLPGVPVWHMHESIERLQRLAHSWRTVAIGSSGQWRSPGTNAWWKRMGAAMDAICDEHGRPQCRLHGLRMLDPAIFQQLPLASADSTNAAVNGGSVSRFGMYIPPSAGQRACVIADRIEAHISAPIWSREPQVELAF